MRLKFDLYPAKMYFQILIRYLILLTVLFMNRCGYLYVIRFFQVLLICETDFYSAFINHSEVTLELMYFLKI